MTLVAEADEQKSENTAARSWVNDNDGPLMMMMMMMMMKALTYVFAMYVSVVAARCPSNG